MKIRSVRAEFFHVDRRTEKLDEANDSTIILVTRGHTYLVRYFTDVQTSVILRNAVFWCVTPCRVEPGAFVIGDGSSIRLL